MGTDSKLVPECQRWAVFPLKSNVSENWLGDRPFVPCALSCGCDPEPPVNMGAIMEGNKNVKRYMEAPSCTRPKDPARLELDVMVPVGICQLQDTVPCWGGETLNYFFLCLFKHHYPEKHLEKRHCLFQKKPWEKVMDCRSLLSHTPRSRLHPVPITFWEKGRECHRFIFLFTSLWFG